MAEVTYSVRERQGAGYGPVIGKHVAASDAPPDGGTLIEVKGKLMRVVASGTGGFDNTLVVEPYADPG